MSLGLGTHAEFEPPSEWEQPCHGRIVVIDDQGPMWFVKCAECGTEWGLPARKVDPTRHNEHLLERRRSCCGIPNELQGLSLPSDDSDLSRALRDWATGRAEHRGIMITGAEGRGKTHAVASAAWERTKLGPLRWLYVPALFARLNLDFGDDQREDALRTLVGTETLVLDDIDKARRTEFASEQLLMAIDVRMTDGAGLLVTTNLMPSELADRFPGHGPKIVSRLRGYCETFLLEGPDRRLERFAA